MLKPILILLISAVLTSALTLSAGCKKDKPTGSDGAAKPAGNTVTVPSALAVQKPSLQTDKALEQLPAQTSMVAGVDSAQQWLSRLGYAAIRAQHKAMFAKIAAESVSEIGFDGLDPAAWTERGLDLSGSAGFALIDPVRESFVLWASLSDSAKALAMIQDVSKRTELTLKIEKSELGTVVRTPDGLRPRGGFLLTEKTIFVAMTGRDGGTDALSTLLAVKKADSLSASPRLKDALKQLAYGQQASVFVDMAALVKSIESENPGHISPSERKVLEGFGGDLWMAFGAQLGDKTVHLKSIYGLSDKSWLSGIFTTRANPTRLVQVTEKTPIYLANGSVDMKAVWRMINAAVKAAGEDDEMAGASAQLEKMAGLTLQSAIVGMLTGEFGLAITGAIDVNTQKDNLADIMGGHLLVGVANSDALRTSMDLALKLVGGGEFVKKAGDGNWVIPVPGYKDIYVTLGKDWLSLSPDKSFAKRAAAGGTGFAPKLANPDLKNLLTTGSAAGVGMLDWRALGWLVYRSSPDWKHERKTESGPARVIREEIRKREDALEKQQMEAFVSLVDKLGTAGFAVEPQGSNLVGRGGFYLNATPADLTALAVSLAIKAETVWREERDEISALQEKLWTLDQQENAP